MRIPVSFLEELKQRLPVEEVISSYVDLRRTGRNLKGLCPFHSEKTPSFMVYDDTQSFYCFGCGKGGDLITFIMEAEHLDYIEAVKFLAQKAGMTMPEDSYDDKAERMRLRILELNRAAGRYFHSCLISDQGKEGLQYITGRGLKMGLIRKFGLGFAPDSWDATIIHLREQGFTDREMETAGIAKRSAKGHLYCYFRNRVMFPIIDVRGNVIAFGGRIMTDEKPKYLNSPDSPVYKKTRQLFALNFAKNTKEDTLVLTEGYMDAISLYKAGMDNAVATCGTALTDDQARLMGKYAKQVVVAYDSDEAGQKATARAINILDKAGIQVKVLAIEGAKDPDEYLKKFGAERLKNSVHESANAYAFRLESVRKKHNIMTDEGKVAFLKETVKILAEISSPLERDVFIGRISTDLDIPRQSIEEAVKQTRKYRKKEATKKIQQIARSPVSDSLDKINPERRGKERESMAEDQMLACVVNHPDKLEQIRAGLQGDPLATKLGEKMLSFIEQQITQTGGFDLSMCAEAFSPQEMSYLTGIMARYNEIRISDEDIRDCTEVIRAGHRKLEPESVAKLEDSEYEEYLKKIMKQKK